MKVGRIHYLNTEPFFSHWHSPAWELVPGTPRQLAQQARAGQLIAGPLPLVECWTLEDSFEPLGAWGIAAKKESRSVFLLSQTPFHQMNNASIGVSTESSTSVVLCRLLIEKKFGHRVQIKQGLTATDDAWLVIGDMALQMWCKKQFGKWPYVTDLAAEWWGWQKLPFVFARWVVSRTLPAQMKQDLYDQLDQSVAKGLHSFSNIAWARSFSMGVPSPKLVEYLSGFNYELGPEEEKAIQTFRDLAEKTEAAVK